MSFPMTLKRMGEREKGKFLSTFDDIEIQSVSGVWYEGMVYVRIGFDGNRNDDNQSVRSNDGNHIENHYLINVTPVWKIITVHGGRHRHVYNEKSDGFSINAIVHSNEDR